MIELFKLMLPVLCIIFGWLLSESGKIFTDKRQDKKKLRKLLFFLLELRYRFASELSYELEMEKYVGIIKSKLQMKFGYDLGDPEMSAMLGSWKPFLVKLTTRVKEDNDNYEYLNENIDKIIIELAEILPILA